MSLDPDFANELGKSFGGDIRTDLPSRILYSTDASIYQIEPLGVVFPKTQDDLHAAVELAAKYRVPILPRGAGTSLAGQAIGHALIVDCSRWLTQLLEVNPEDHSAIVEPGVLLANLNKAAASYDLQYGPDPASAERATMGGVIANNATGAHSLSFGMSADHLNSADVIMADGSLATLGQGSTLDNALVSNLYSAILEIRQKNVDAIRMNWPTTWRNSGGYRLNYLLPWSPSKPSQWEGEYPPRRFPQLNLAPLLAGSEGTLAIIRRAKVNLVPKPKHTVLATLSYQSIGEACEDVPRLLTHHPSAVELIPRMLIRLARGIPAYARQMGWVIGDPAALLVVEFSSDQPSALKEAARNIGEILTVAESAEEQNRIWNIRKVGLGLLDSRPQSARPVAFIEDCAIPVQRLGEFVHEVEMILNTHGAEAGIYAHASAGCLHIRPILDLKTARGVTDLRSISEAVFALTLSLGGAMSSEHGDGLSRSEFLERTYGADLMEAMRSLKRAADPQNILNPGKIIDSQKMDMNLRYGAAYQTRVWDSGLSFARHGGLAAAIEQCNGQGVCRKESGVMCPSYQATREEMHSTRGRANLLRALISQPYEVEGGPTRSSRLGSMGRVEATAAALDLCLACKGCKAECPSGVDMAKLKFAFQAEYYKTHPRQLRDYVFGYFHVTAALAASVAPISNALMEIPLVKNLLAQILGITPHRAFPRFSKHRSRARFKPPNTAGMPDVIFLSDPFARYIEPETERAALEILSRCGFHVHLVPTLGAGAALLSKGFIEGARHHAGRVLDGLKQIDPMCKVPIVGIEPPELYTLKHDYIDLLPEREKEIKQRVQQVWLLDEFLVRSQEFEALRVGTGARSFNREEKFSRKLQFHPHCHQRAEAPAAEGMPNGANATIELLSGCGYEVELMDTGCCGMAGAFGYEAEHYDLSMRVGGLKLFPKLNSFNLKREGSEYTNTEPIVKVVASGAACRLQIRHGTRVQVKHPIELVRDILF